MRPQDTVPQDTMLQDTRPPSTFLVFGASGQTGQHFVRLVLNGGHHVRALVRTPARLTFQSPALDVRQGDITRPPDLDALLQGTDFVVLMLGDAAAQRHARVNTAFVRQLVPAMRRQGVRRLLYQAGGLSRPPHQPLSLPFQLLRSTVARGYSGQHEDNEAVMTYLTESASDIEWMVHRAGIGSNGPSRGVLERSEQHLSVATFVDCAAYSYRLLLDPAAIHTCDLSRYRKG